jgi:hypothetical protein
VKTIKEMPVKEKYANLLATIKQDAFTPVYIGEKLGRQARQEYEEECRKVTRPVPENASDKDKYEIDYGNWITTGDIAFNTIRKHGGEEGLKQYIRADVEAIKRTNSGPAFLLLKLIRIAAPGAAFKLMANEISYKLQWLTDYSVSELSRRRVVLEIAHCKVLDYPGNETGCAIGCRTIYPMWLAEQFGLEMKMKREGFSCTLSIEPLKPH